MVRATRGPSSRTSCDRPSAADRDGQGQPLRRRRRDEPDGARREKRDTLADRVAALREIHRRRIARRPFHPVARPRGRAPRDQGGDRPRRWTSVGRRSTSTEKRAAIGRSRRRRPVSCRQAGASPASAATSSGTATGPSSSASASTSTTSSRPSTASTASCRPSRCASTSSTPKPSARSVASPAAKWAQHEELTATMTDIIRDHGLSTRKHRDRPARSIGVDRVEVTGESWRLVNNDCVAEVRRWPPDSGRPDRHVDPVRQPLRVHPGVQRLRAHRRQRALLGADGLPDPAAAARPRARAGSTPATSRTASCSATSPAPASPPSPRSTPRRSMHGRPPRLRLPRA